MENKLKNRKYNFFIINRIDRKEESEKVTDVYDLSIFNKIKTKKNKFSEEIISTIENDRPEIMKVVKKMILGVNLSFNWRMIKVKELLLLFHFIFIFSGIFGFFKNQNYLETQQNDSNSKDQSNKKSSHLLFTFIKEISLHFSIIPTWVFFQYKIAPKSKKINKMIKKLASYLLYDDSIESENNFYELNDDFSIKVTNKKYLNSSNQSIIKEGPEKNIFSYCVTIIIDYILDEFFSISYNKLISRSDYSMIHELFRFMEKLRKEKMKIIAKNYLLPALISFLFVVVFCKNPTDIFAIFISILSICVTIMIAFIEKDFSRKTKKDIDNFIKKYNKELIKKNKFIFRKNRLIMFLSLKEEGKIYNLEDVEKSIKKIILS